MKSQIIEQAEKTIQEAEERLHEIEQAESHTIRSETEAKEQIEQLKARLPSLLAARAMGETNPDLFQIKGEISLAEDAIDNTPLTLEGLDELKRPELAKIREARRVLGKIEKYDAIKEQIEKGSDMSLCSSLRDYARALGIEDECESFIRSLTKVA